MIKNEFDFEQIKLLTEVDNIRNKCMGSKRTGHEVCAVVSKYIQHHLPVNYKVVGPNVFVDDLPTEFDLLVLTAEAQSLGAAYQSSDVRIVLEVKTAGIRASKGQYPEKIKEIRENFDSIKMKNTKVWGVLLMCYGTIRPKREESFQYEKIRKEGLEPYGYGVYTLAQSDQPEWGKWEEFMKRLLANLID